MRGEINGSDGGRLQTPTDARALARRGLNALGLERYDGDPRRITVGKSGAAVLAVEVDGHTAC